MTYDLEGIIDLKERVDFALGLARAGEFAAREIDTDESVRVFEAIFDSIWTKLKPIAEALEREERTAVSEILLTNGK